MKQILIIAKDMRAGREEARYAAFVMAAPDEWRERHGEIRSIDGNVGIFYASPHLAVQQMVGLNPEKIIIVGDYLRWNAGPPGHFAHMAQFIDTVVARGAKREWVR